MKALSYLPNAEPLPYALYRSSPSRTSLESPWRRWSYKCSWKGQTHCTFAILLHSQSLVSLHSRLCSCLFCLDYCLSPPQDHLTCHQLHSPCPKSLMFLGLLLPHRHCSQLLFIFLGLIHALSLGAHSRLSPAFLSASHLQETK